MKMTIENQKQTRNETPKVVLKRADRETTTKSEGSIAEENRTGSPKGTTDNTYANQSSPTLGEMTQKMKMTIENQKQTRNETPKVVLKRADRETTTKSEGSIAEENRTGSPKGTTDNTHANQSSPTLGEMTQKMKMTIENQKETRNETPKVVLKRADRETTKSEGSETKEVADISVPMSENSENTVERKTSKVVVHSPVEPTN